MEIGYFDYPKMSTYSKSPHFHNTPLIPVLPFFPSLIKKTEATP